MEKLNVEHTWMYEISGAIPDTFDIEKRRFYGYK